MRKASPGASQPEREEIAGWLFIRIICAVRIDASTTEDQAVREDFPPGPVDLDGNDWHS